MTVAVVLHEPQDLVNIAHVVRALKNFGFRDLRLVSPREYDPYRVEGIAHQTQDVLARVARFDRLEDALLDCVHVVGFTARGRTAKRNLQRPREAAAEILTRGEAGPVALLFGREDKGLPNEALDLVRYGERLALSRLHVDRLQAARRAVWRRSGRGPADAYDARGGLPCVGCRGPRVRRLRDGARRRGARLRAPRGESRGRASDRGRRRRAAAAGARGRAGRCARYADPVARAGAVLEDGCGGRGGGGPDRPRGHRTRAGARLRVPRLARLVAGRGRRARRHP